MKITHEGRDDLLVVHEPGDTSLGRGDHVTITIDGPIHMFGPDGSRL